MRYGGWFAHRLLVGQLPAQPRPLLVRWRFVEGAAATFSVAALPGVSALCVDPARGVEVESGREFLTTFAEDAVSGRLSVYGKLMWCWTIAIHGYYCEPASGRFRAVLEGPDDICQGSKGVVFTVDAIPHAETYNWSLSVGTR